MKRGRERRSPASMGAGVAVGQRRAAVVPGLNPNLLLWSEAFDNALWSKTSVTVTADAANDPGGQPTAEHIVFGAGGAVRQVTGIAATSGDPVTVNTSSAETRPSVTGVFDGTTYVFSIYPAGDGTSFRLRIDRSGGNLRVSVEDVGDEAVLDLAWAKLETPDLTAYVKREGI